MDWGQIGTETAMALIPVLVLVVTALVTMAFTYLRQRYTWLQKTQTDEEVEAMAKGVVVSLQQSVVDGLKAASEDGKLTPEEIASIKQQALTALQLQLTEGQKKILATMTGDITAWLSGKIEKSLAEYKLKTAIMAPTFPIIAEPANPLQAPTEQVS